MFRTIRIVVVFPAPFAPRNPNTWPGATRKPMPSRATTSPKRLRRPSMTSVMRGWSAETRRSEDSRRPSAPPERRGRRPYNWAVAVPGPSTIPARIHADRAGRSLAIEWSDGHASTYEFTALRWLCPCAFCRGEAGLPGWLDTRPTLTADQTSLVDIHLVGQYAVAPEWGDGHH